MKNIKILSVLFFVLTMMACEEKEYEAPNTFSDVSWYTSQLNDGGYTVREGEFVAFRDLSQNSLSHQWTIEDGCFFLSDGFSKGDSLVKYIDESLGNISEESTVNVLFNSPGLKTVRLINTFEDKVSFNGENGTEAVKEGDVWVFDTTFVVDVYADVLPAYEVYKLIEDDDGNVIDEELLLSVAAEDSFNIEDSTEWDLIQVEVGGRLKFVDLSDTGRPTGRTWTIYNKQTPEVTSDSIAEVYFNKLNYTANLTGTIRSERFSSTGDIPGSTRSKLIPLRVQTIPSTKPFKFTGNINETEDEIIQFEVSGEAKPLPENVEDAFTVHVTNDGFDEIIPVKVARLNSEDRTTIELVLAEPIYGTDVVSVAFDNTQAQITSIDDRMLESFTPKVVEMYFAGVNILDNDAYHGFEASNTNITSAYCPRYWKPNSDPAWQRTELKNFEGTASMMFSSELDDDKTLWGMGFTDKQAIPAGTYILKHMIYIEEGSTIKSLHVDMANKSDGWVPLWQGDWNLENVKRGEWVAIEQEVKLPKEFESRLPATSGAAGRYSYYVRVADNSGVQGVQTFYMDGTELIPLEDRP